MALRNEREQGKEISVYTASTKGNTLLQVFGLDHTLIRSAAERNPEKWGKHTVGTWIPIVSEAEARAHADDFQGPPLALHGRNSNPRKRFSGPRRQTNRSAPESSHNHRRRMAPTGLGKNTNVKLA